MKNFLASEKNTTRGHLEICNIILSFSSRQVMVIKNVSNYHNNIHNYQRIHVDTVTFKQNHRKAMDMKKVIIQKNTKDSMNTEK